MVAGLALILLCQLLGEALVRAAHLPVPGPVVGMLLFWAWLSWRRPAAEASEVRAADGLLAILPMLFVPAGIGVMVYLGELGANAVAVVGGLLGSWLLTLLATGAVASLLRPRSDA